MKSNAPGRTEQDAGDPTVLGTQPRPTEVSDGQIGPYRLLVKIGEGGFGEVWLAEQKEPVKRRVALKIIKLGMDTKQVVARFEAERQALALMDHPNIAKVFDGGATELGRPFFVMEHVKGVPITDYCNTNKLGTTHRLELFIQVCRAIQHAHQKGIIHRDIKPSNILVTMQDGLPVPKVIDFGIAKATQMELTEKTIHTQLNQFIGTPAYMSPEQAEMTGIDIDTRSDIYSLGVLLYELLTGSTPFDTKELLSAGLDEMRRIIREVEPLRPSTRLSKLVGDDVRRLTSPSSSSPSPSSAVKSRHSALDPDLDWIVLKCLEKDRTRRYETANGLALDIQRHLQHEPVTARPPSTAYRLRKFARRHQTTFAAGTFALLALLAALVFTNWSALRARAAERREKILRATADQTALEARRNLYAADVLLAYQADAEGNLGRARELLRKYSGADGSTEMMASLRGWEWWHLSERLRGGEVRILRGHTHEVPVALFFPDGKRVFSAAADGTCRFWNIDDGQELQQWKIDSVSRAAAVSPNGKFIALASETKRFLTVRDAATGLTLAVHTNHNTQSGACFSRDGTMLAVADEEHVHLYRSPEFEEFKTISRPGEFGGSFLKGLAFSADNTSIAYCGRPSDRRLILHRLSDGTETVVSVMPELDALSISLSPDGKWLAAGNSAGIVICNIAEARIVRILTDHHEQVCKVTFSPDGKFLASASGDQTVRLWDVSRWETVRVFRGHENEVQALDFSPDGRWLVSGSKDETIRIWDTHRLSPGEERRLVSLNAFNLGETHKLPLRYSSNEFAMLNLADSREEPKQVWIPQGDSVLGISPNLTALATSTNKVVTIWAQSPFKELLSFSIPKPAKFLALSEDATLLAISDAQDDLTIYDLQPRSQRTIFSAGPMDLPIGRLRGSPMAFVAQDGILLRNATEIQAGGQIELVDLKSSSAIRINLTHKGELTSYAVSPDGRLLATAAYDGRIKLWERSSGLEIANLPGQLIGFLHLAFSHDGTRLAAGGQDGTITLWDMKTMQQVAKWRAHRKECAWVQFLENDQALASLQFFAIDIPPNSGTAFAPHELKIWRAPRDTSRNVP